MTECEKTGEMAAPEVALILEAVIAAVTESENKLTPVELEKRLSQQFSVQRTIVKAAIKHLVEKLELAYTYNYGCSFLEKSFNKPTRISDRVVLKPPGTLFRPIPNDIVVDIQPGASFGIGEHPTTRLAIRAMERVLSDRDFFHCQNDLPALDIGTGSGVLAIVAALLGAAQVLGLDIDPCAITEARKNVHLNNLEHRIVIDDRAVETIDEIYALIVANLRHPTLKRLAPHIRKITETGSVFIVSGLKTTEVPDLVRVYSQLGFRCDWGACEHDWACVVLER